MDKIVRMPQFRVGTGYDVHKLVEDRKLILCGVEVPYELGLLGHSDADVALHALSDALLGAAALGDIGKHFPDTDERFKGADSAKLLEYVVFLVQEKGWQVNNVDAEKSGKLEVGGASRHSTGFGALEEGLISS